MSVIIYSFHRPRDECWQWHAITKICAETCRE